ncbi:MAG: DNA recombination protein RmuC [Alphaproteobacteria bacterium]|jgi:DNA recombination protein RmuC
MIILLTAICVIIFALSILLFLALQKKSAKLLELEKAVSFKEAENFALKQTIENKQQLQSDFLKLSQNSISELAIRVSSKLLDDHKRENDEIKKRNDEVVIKSSEEINKKIQEVFSKIKSLDDNVKENGKIVDKIKTSLLDPIAGGSLAEITLENLFKAFKLIKTVDYEMQYTVASQTKTLRPDAIIFLPQNEAILVDAKSSKFFLEYDERDNSEPLKKALNAHLDKLIEKDYSGSVALEKKKKVLFTAMFISSDVILEKIKLLDANFFDRAFANNILPVGPSSLASILMQTQMIIRDYKQSENVSVILDEVKKLLNNIANLSQYANSLSRSLKSTFTHFDKFSTSFNATFLNRSKKLHSLGVEVVESKKIEPIEGFQILSKESDNLFDQENIIKLEKQS